MTDTIAIDFGTSRTKLAYLKDGKPELMRFGHDRVYAPSLFYLPGVFAVLMIDALLLK